jgi:2-iminoacetate synthase
MQLAKSGNIGKICVPNAMTTFEEYLNDFASDETKEVGRNFLSKELNKINGITKKKTLTMIERIDAGERDVYL